MRQWMLTHGSALPKQPDIVVRDLDGRGSWTLIDIKTTDVAGPTALSRLHTSTSRLFAHARIAEQSTRDYFGTPPTPPLAAASAALPLWSPPSDPSAPRVRPSLTSWPAMPAPPSPARKDSVGGRQECKGVHGLSSSPESSSCARRTLNRSKRTKRTPAQSRRERIGEGARMGRLGSFEDATSFWKKSCAESRQTVLQADESNSIFTEACSYVSLISDPGGAELRLRFVG